MKSRGLSAAQQTASAATACRQERTGHEPKSVVVVLSGDTLLITLHGALSPAEKALAQSPEGAAQVQEFHKQLFHNSADTLRQDIKRITGVDVREATAEVEPISGSVVQVFTTGTMVQVYPSPRRRAFPARTARGFPAHNLDPGFRGSLRHPDEEIFHRCGQDGQKQDGPA